MTDLTQHPEWQKKFLKLISEVGSLKQSFREIAPLIYAAGRKAGLEKAATHVWKNCVDGDINTIEGFLSSLWEIIALEIIALETLEDKS